MSAFVIGDIHGAHKALMQCIERSGIEPESDALICLGDVADSWPEVPQCFDTLLEFRNLIYVIGNHDEWLLEWFKTGYAPAIWTSQGGIATLEAYQKLLITRDFDRIKKHQHLLEHAFTYYVDADNNLYLHGGFDWHIPLEQNSRFQLIWDRHLWETANMWKRQKQDFHFD